MPGITFENRYYESLPGETVLQTLLRNRIHVPYYCQIGSCKTCVVRVTEGPVPPGCQETLPAVQVERGCFMTCICIPDRDLVIAKEDA